jgi:protein-S-isoprenylcysteine O-methyltransferase Ste14
MQKLGGAPIDSGGGAICIVIWLALDGSAMLRFRSARTSMVPMKPSTALVTSGPYLATRNPMYVGMAFLYAGLALLLGVIWSLAFLPAVLLMVDRFVIAREERYLEAKFGEEYRAYKGRVRRWL